MSITAFTLIVFLCHTGYIIQSSKHMLKTHLQEDANQIEQTLKKVFDDTSELMLSLSKQISTLKNKHKIKAIESVLNQNPEAVYHMGTDTNSTYAIDKSIESIYHGSVQKLPSWRKLFWIPPHDNIILNSRLVQEPQTINLSHRSYILESRKNPWILHFSAPTIGFPTGLWEIPAGIGIVDQEGQYLGTLAVGFTIGELNLKLQQEALKHQSSFIVLDENYKVVLQSFDNSINLKASYYGDILNKFPLPLGNQGDIEAINYNGISYNHYKKVQIYPYIILTGFRENLFFWQIFESIFPRLIEIIIMGHL